MRKLCYDWSAVSRFYDKGNSVAQCKKKFGFNNRAWALAVKRGDVTPRASGPPTRVTQFSRDHLLKAAKKARSYSEFCRILGFSRFYAGPLKARLQAEGIPTDFNYRGGGLPFALQDVMTKGSAYSRSCLKKQIIANRVIPYCCAICTNNGVWNGEDLVLRLDHINGIRNDHRKENLRFLCPNCDSQQPTFSGRNVRWCKSNTSRSEREESACKS